MSLTKALKRIFVGAPSDEEPRMPDGSPEPMTRQEFEDQIVDHFRYRLRKETTKGSLVYPTNFYIYLTPTDYEEQKEAFPFTVLDVVNEFNAIIGDKRKEYPSFTPIAKYWQFQFLRFEEGTMIENMRETVSGMEDGSVLVMSYIFTKENLDVVAQENVRVVTTKRNKGTVKTHQLSINTDALRGLRMESETLYKVPAGNFSKVGIDSVSKEMEFIRLSSYGSGTKSSGKVNAVDISLPDLNNKNVLIVEDIIDTGHTAKFLIDFLHSNFKIKSLKFCSLLDKKIKREVDVEADYYCFEVDDKFLIGYGLDYDGLYRNIPYIGYIENQ